MKILIISNGHSSDASGVNISGGDVRWIEIAKIWMKMGHEIYIFTTPEGLDLCTKLNLQAKFYLFDNKKKINSMIINYIYLSIKSTIYVPKDLFNLKLDLIYSVTEHYYDVVPALILKKSINCRWSAVVHWVAPIKRHGDIFKNLLFFLQQRIGLAIIKTFADTILAVSPHTRDDLIRLGFKYNNVYIVNCGVDWYGIKNIVDKSKNSPKRFDAVFMKRLHSAKGVFDLVDIWKKVTAKKSDAKLIVIGGGPKSIVSKLENLIKENGLTDNILLMGSIYDFDDKINLIIQSKIFILPTYEENWAIVIGEALSCRLPVICYDLPEIRPIWNDTVIWVPKGDVVKFSETIIDLLNLIENKNKLFEEFPSHTFGLNWENIGIKELDLSLINNHLSGV